MARTVAVTGPTGHVGVNLLRELAAGEDRVRCLVNDDGATLAGFDVERIDGDVLDEASLRQTFEGAEVVFHLAGIISINGDRGGLLQRVNVHGAANAARVAREMGVRRFVHVCSIHAFSPFPVGELLDETRPRVAGRGHPPYDLSKAAGEAAVRAEIRPGFDVVIAHPSGVIGPFDHAPSRMGQTFLDLYHGRMPAGIDGGFDFVDVRDVARGLLLAAEHGRSGESYLLNGTWVHFLELARMTAEVTGAPAPRRAVPMWMVRPVAPLVALAARMQGREGVFTPDALRALRLGPRVDRSKAERELGYQPRPFEESVRDIFDWFKQAGRLEGGPLMR